jgi:hypothetical protein
VGVRSADTSDAVHARLPGVIVTAVMDEPPVATVGQEYTSLDIEEGRGGGKWAWRSPVRWRTGTFGRSVPYLVVPLAITAS